MPVVQIIEGNGILTPCNSSRQSAFTPPVATDDYPPLRGSSRNVVQHAVDRQAAILFGKPRIQRRRSVSIEELTRSATLATGGDLLVA